MRTTKTKPATKAPNKAATKLSYADLGIESNSSAQSPTDDSDNSSSSSGGASSESSHTKVTIKDSGLIVNKTKHAALRSIGEEAWNQAGEDLVSGWAEQCMEKSEYHSGKESKNKVLHAIFGLPSILLPVLLAAATPLIDTLDEAALIQVSGLITIGVVSSINTFFNFDKKSARHQEYSARYNELATDVQYQLFKGREFRVSSDEFIARVQTKFNNLNEKAP